LLRVVWFAGRIECFPTRLLPCRASVPQIDCGLVKNRIEPRTISIGHPGRNKRSTTTNAFGIKRCVFLRDPRFCQSADNATCCSTCGCADRRGRKPTGCDNWAETGDCKQAKASQQTCRTTEPCTNPSALSGPFCAIINAITVTVYLFAAVVPIV